jgi:hypothetical protein
MRFFCVLRPQRFAVLAFCSNIELLGKLKKIKKIRKKTGKMTLCLPLTFEGGLFYEGE